MADPRFTFQGKPCKLGHTLRWRYDGSCIECKRASARKRPHPRRGINTHPLYWRWHDIKKRCLRPYDPGYKRYGAKGRGIIERWSKSSAIFIAEVQAEIGPLPSPLHTLDRIDNKRGYEPGNIRWALRNVQARNRDDNKLTLEKVRLIRQLHIKGTNRFHRGNTAELAMRFAVSLSHMRAVTNGSWWKE